jgi:hypothetical protein
VEPGWKIKEFPNFPNPPKNQKIPKMAWKKIKILENPRKFLGVD